MPNTYWDDWIKNAEAFLAGKTSEPPEAPPSFRVLELVTIVKELDRLLRDPHTTVAMPHLHRRIKKALK